jgi:hypothetical protein
MSRSRLGGNVPVNIQIQNMHSPIIVWLLTWSAGLVTSACVVADPAAILKSYRAPVGGPVWGQSFGLSPSGPGFLLMARGSAPGAQPGQSSVSVVRLDLGGDIISALWSTEGVQGITTFQAHPTEPLIFTQIEGLAEEEFWTVFGVFKASDGTPVYQRGVRVTVDQSKEGSYFPDPVPRVIYLRDGRTAVLMDGNGPVVRVAVLDPAGQPQWERTFGSLVTPSFTAAGLGPHSVLIEAPDGGFWLIVAGSQKITTEPNPPPINYAVSLNVIRLTSTGEHLWAKRVVGLEIARATPAFGPVGVGADGSLVISFTDMVMSTPSSSGPADLQTYLLALKADGELGWARRVRRAKLAPILGQESSALYLYGVQFHSFSPVNVDGLILKWDAATGETRAQARINLATIEDPVIAGVSEERVFVHAQAYSPNRVLVGAFDLDLQNPVWKQLEPDPIAASALVYSHETRSLLFARRPTEDSRIDMIELGPDLNPLAWGEANQEPGAPCRFFSDATVSMLDPNLVVDQLELTQQRLFVTVYTTSLRLSSVARIQLRSLAPMVEELCSQATADPRLSWAVDRSAGAFTVRFVSHPRRTYEILFTAALGQPFAPIAIVNGDGQVISRTFQAAHHGNGFYTVRALPR